MDAPIGCFEITSSRKLGQKHPTVRRAPQLEAGLRLAYPSIPESLVIYELPVATSTLPATEA
jgi:hypothetical protein